ncbi:hypothetical protein [uncultured Tateyamaria sp.]|uniref:hypothetical protein n=1 Tax=Tateyamaria sp. 1078 TaxID=3417464 RepID=UPI00261D8012|nr:hypothetical protein [uncultured Tateyamaria sp.]
MIRSALLVLTSAGLATAQDQISAEEFLDQLTGKTATFVIWGTDNLVGVEQFVRRDRTVWARSDGSCAYGTVTIDGPLVCFTYDDERNGRQHCWFPFVQDGTLLVLDDEGDEIQAVSEITDRPVACNPPPIS